MTYIYLGGIRKTNEHGKMALAAAFTKQAELQKNPVQGETFGSYPAQT